MKAIPILLAVVVCVAASPATAEPAIYDVDPAYRDEVVSALRRMLSMETRGLQGSVSVLPTGQLLVDTFSPERQAEVAAVLAAIASAEPEETPVVSLNFWVLHGVPGAGDASGLPSALADVTRELEAVYGEHGFEILDAATVSSGSGQGGVFESDRWTIVQEASVNGDRLNASIVIEHEFQTLTVELALDRGEYVVLGAGTSREIAENGMLAIVVNWPEG